MSEENAIYVTADEKMRAALESAKLYIDSRNLPDTHLTDRMLKQIDEALAMKSPEIVPVRYHQAWGNGYQACLDDSLLEQKSILEKNLFELPASIKSQSSIVADLTASIEKLRLSIASIKNRALELVLSATNEGKPMYSNDKARNMAVEQLLREDKLYLDNCDEIGRKECSLRKEQIQLDFLHNSFSAFRAIAGLAGVK